MSAGIKYAALTIISGAFLLIGMMGPLGLYWNYELFNSRPEWSITGFIFWKMTAMSLVMCGMLILSFWILKKAASFGRVHRSEVAQVDAARAHAKQVRESAASEARTAREASTIRALVSKAAKTNEFVCKECGQSNWRQSPKLGIVERCEGCGKLNSLVKADSPLGKKIKADWQL